MKVIGMLGYTEKVDLVVSIAKTLQLLGKTVLVVDGTNDGKYAYTIPSLETVDKKYINQFDKIDFAVGFESMADLENYLVSLKINIGLYDYVLIDIDNPKTYEFFRSKPFDNIYFVIDTSMLSLKKNEDIISSIKVYTTSATTVEPIKIMYRGMQTRAFEKYFENRMNSYQFNWSETELEIIEDDRDKMLYQDFLLTGMIQIKRHTRYFINSIISVISTIADDVTPNQIRNVIKKGGV